MLLTTYLLNTSRSSEMSVNFHLSTRRHIAEYGTVLSHRCENHEPNVFMILCSYFLTSQVSIKQRCAARHSELHAVNTVVFNCRLNYQPSNCKLSEATTSERLQPGNTRRSLSDARSGSVPHDALRSDVTLLYVK